MPKGLANAPQRQHWMYDPWGGPYSTQAQRDALQAAYDQHRNGVSTPGTVANQKPKTGVGTPGTTANARKPRQTLGGGY